MKQKRLTLLQLMTALAVLGLVLTWIIKHSSI